MSHLGPAPLMNCTSFESYAGPVLRWLPGGGTMSSRTARTRDFLARFTITRFGSNTESGAEGSLLTGTPRKRANPLRSARSHASISWTATRKQSPAHGLGTHAEIISGAHASLSRSTRRIQRRWAAAAL